MNARNATRRATSNTWLQITANRLGRNMAPNTHNSVTPNSRRIMLVGKDEWGISKQFNERVATQKQEGRWKLAKQEKNIVLLE